MQTDVFDLENTSNTQDYEQTSYGKFAYKRVQRLRRKGKRRGIQVPYLNYELTKPEKPRTAFWIVAVLSAVLLSGVIVGLGFLYNKLIGSISIFDGMGDVLKAVFDPSTFALSAGLSAIPGLMIFLAYLLLILMFVLPLIAILYVYRFVRDTFYMAQCSKEEFAKGSLVSSRLTGYAVGIVVCTVLFIVILTNAASGAKLTASLVYAGIVAVLGTLLVLTALEKRKCAQWFETLGENKKQNYLSHEKALRRVKSRLKMEKQVWSDLGK